MDRRTILLGAAGAGAFALGGAALMRPSGQPLTGGSLLPVGAAHAQTDETEVAADAPYEVVEMELGNPDAPVTLIEYASFTCPHCANFHDRVMPQLKADYVDTGRIRFIYREVYFDRPGLWAAMVARCAGPDRYFGVSDLIYERQREWVQGAPRDIVDALMAIGRTAGLDNDELNACLTDAGMAQAMMARYEATMEEHPIGGTPSLVINDELHSNMSYEDLSALLDEALTAAE